MTIKKKKKIKHASQSPESIEASMYFKPNFIWTASSDFIKK